MTVSFRLVITVLFVFGAFGCLQTATGPGGAGSKTSGGAPGEVSTSMGGDAEGSEFAQAGGEKTADAPPMPSGPVAPNTDYPGGMIRLKASYERICRVASPIGERIRLEGGVVSTWPLIGRPEVCAFGGERGLRVVYEAGVTGGYLLNLRFLDVPVREDGTFPPVVFDTFNVDTVRFYLLRRAQESVTEEKTCAKLACVDADLNGDVDDVFCSVTSSSDLGGVLAESNHQGPVPECVSGQLMMKKLPAVMEPPSP